MQKFNDAERQYIYDLPISDTTQIRTYIELTEYFDDMFNCLSAISDDPYTKLSQVECIVPGEFPTDTEK